MSTNKTTNYQLHSWLPSDEFHLTEINENFAALDAALKAEATAWTQGLAALTAGLNGKPDIVTGTYVGTGAQALIQLGRKPTMVHIEKQNGARSTNFTHGGLFREDSGTSDGGITAEDAGFALSAGHLNTKGTTYLYVAYFLG